MSPSLSGRSLLETYLEHRAPGARSGLGNAGTGGSGQPTSDPGKAQMFAYTVGICIDRCPWFMRGFAYRKNVLCLWVDLVSGSTMNYRVPTIDQVERSLPFRRGLVWLEEEMRARIGKEKAHADR